MGGRQVSEARRLLTGALDDRPDAELPTAAHETVAELGTPARLGALLRELAAGAGDPAGCARLSYRHVLGFDKLLLFDGGSRHMLRAHVWHPHGQHLAPEDIHNHRSPLASQVVRGSLGMELYEEVPDGTAREHGPDGGGRETVRYEESLADAGDWLLTERGRARLRLTHVARYAAGSGYALAPHALHRAWCTADEPTVTLFLEAGAHRRPHTDVFSAPGPRRAPATAKHPLPVADYLSELTALARLVDG
ncbi:hypothetical protein DY218_19490 [Streptomyces triticagri]|uniref:Cysteine dioxygenase n=1 Tax=Streptomyces triticagri TaxID=2293568 RepID=A0A372M2G4_9ACTN|nr:hypothetical protein [Streptomyces triticagri]RFU85019.1 hypothetical protein DY218_19490 [Streptomyces triticagri]